VGGEGEGRKCKWRQKDVQLAEQKERPPFM